ncbi:MAG: hypothetical protein ACM3SM_03860 [Bacteroidota bacterium]
MKMPSYKMLLLPAAGALLGYAYYYFAGCSQGCAVTGNPYTSIGAGALLGFVLIPGRKQS